MVYELRYHAPQIRLAYAPKRRAGKLKYCNVFVTIIPLAPVGFEVVIATSLVIYHLISNARPGIMVN